MPGTASVDAPRAPGRAAAARGLFSPAVDWLSAGGLSLAALALLAALPAARAEAWMAAAFIPLSVALNWPHFMASYHLLYSTPGAFEKHPHATKTVPALLAAYAAAAVLCYGRAPVVAAVFHALAGVFLAWHYTGQAWGAMASFAHVEELRLDDVERTLVRWNLNALMAWHGLWAAHLVARAMGPELFNTVYRAASAGAGVSALLGAAGLALLYKRTGRLPSRVLLPWLALHAWYGLMYLRPGAMCWMHLAQMSHAAQYLIFPARVRANREAPKGARPGVPGLGYAAALTGAGALFFWALPHGADRAAAWLALPGGVAGILLADALAIHHYFVDACVWKLGDKDVRRDLFRHLEA